MKRRTRLAHGSPCHWCSRTMNVNCLDLMPTRDHVHPKSRGGRVIVWACMTCNTLKADMTERQWKLFMVANPQWWNGVPKRAKRALRSWCEKQAREAAFKQITTLPTEYDNLEAQAAFEAVYKDRPHM